MSNEKELLTGLLTQAYGLDETGVTSLYSEDGTELLPDAFDRLLALDKDRVSKLKPDTKSIFQDGYKKAKSETLSEFEKSIQEKFGVKSDKQGLELISEILESKKGGTSLTDDDVKTHRLYLDLMESVKKKESEFEQTLHGKLKEYEAKMQKEQTFNTVKDQALALFDGMKPILPEDPMKSKNLKSIFVSELSNVDYDVRDGKIVLVDADGKDVTDGHGNRVSFESYVKSTAEKYFEFVKGEARNSPGQPSGGTGSITVTSEDDFVEKMGKATTSEEKIALTNAYRKLKS